MSTVIFYDTGGNGSVRKTTGASAPWTDAQWDTLHNAVTGTNLNYGGPDYVYLGVDNWYGDSKLYRDFFYFDTSIIPASAEITEATLGLYPQSAGVSPYGAGVTASTANDTLSVADFGSCGGIEPTVIEASDSRVSCPMATDAYATWNFNASGLGFITPEGVTKLSVRLNKDIDDVNPAIGSPVNYNFLWFSATSETKMPYLEITYGGGGGRTRGETIRRFRTHRR